MQFADGVETFYWISLIAGALEDLPIHNLCGTIEKFKINPLTLDARARFENLSGALNVVSHLRAEGVM